MSNIKINNLAKIMNIDVETLIKKLKSAGINKSKVDDIITDDEVNILLFNGKKENVFFKKKESSSSKIKIFGEKNINLEVKKNKNIKFIGNKNFKNHNYDNKNTNKKENLHNNTIYSKKDNTSEKFIKKIKTFKENTHDKEMGQNTKDEKNNKKRPAKIKKLNKKSLSQLQFEDDNIEQKQQKKIHINNKKNKKNQDHANKKQVSITVKELAKKISTTSDKLLHLLELLGLKVDDNYKINPDIINLLVDEIKKDHSFHNVKKNNILERPPIVTVLGHVDHGKTSLLDFIRKTQITKKEFGGITQHINAYSVNHKNKKITFLDTPGHEAFNIIRSQGLKVADIIILVISVNEGILPQTIEAIKYSKKENIPIIIAINKIDIMHDKNNINKIYNDLYKHNITVEEWSGDSISVLISSKNGQGIDNLLDNILLQAEMLDLKSNNTDTCTGIIIDSKIKKGYGVVSSAIILNGQLKPHDVIVYGLTYSKVRSIFYCGMNIKTATASMPIEITGMNNIIHIGQEIIVVKNEKIAKSIVLSRIKASKEIKTEHYNIDSIFKNMESSKIIINFIIKSDVLGSTDTIRDYLSKFNSEKLKIKFLTCGISNINTNDINLAYTTKAIVIGFNNKIDEEATKLTKQYSIEVKQYNIIYNLINDFNKYFDKIQNKKIKDSTIIGKARVKNIFQHNNYNIAGCIVIHGSIKKSYVKIIRNNNVIVNKVKISSLKRFKEDVNIVHNNTECGIFLENFSDIQLNDIIEML